MNEIQTARRAQLLFQHAEDCQRQLADLALQFEAGGSQAEAALRILKADLSEQIRGVLQGLCDICGDAPALCEIGAKLCCTAVRCADVIFSRDERVRWMQGFRKCDSQFNEPGLKGRLLGNLGNALADLGRLDEAETILKERHECALADGDTRVIGTALENIGKLLIRRGRFREADEKLEAAYRVAVDSNDQSGITRLLKDVADASFRRGESDRGIQLLQERLTRCETVGDPLLTLATSQVLAERLVNLGRLDDAREYAQGAIVVARKLRLPYRNATIQGTLGNIAYEQGQYDSAKLHYTKARRTFRRLGRVIEQGMTATSLGLTAWKQARFRQAVKWFREALAIDQKSGRKNDEAIDLGNLGGVLAAWGRTDEAIECYLSRVRLLADLHEECRMADTLWTVAKIHAERHCFDDAIQCASKALPILDKHKPETTTDIRRQLSEWSL